MLHSPLRVCTSLIYTWAHCLNDDTSYRGWLRHCVTNQTVVGSKTDVVIGIFQWHNPFSRTITLESTQPLTEKRTRNT